MRKGIIISLLLLTITDGFGQAPFFQKYFLLRKSEAVQVNAVFNDRTGYMWWGTNKGLFKFDGIKQQQFTRNDSLPDINVTALAEDKQGRLWIGFKNGSLSYMEKNRVHKFTPAEGNASAEISDILFDKKGNLWFSTLGDGLYYYIENRLYRLDDADHMPDLYIYDIVEDQKGNIWAGTDGGIAICKLKQQKATITCVNYDNGLPDNIIKKITPAIDGTMWLGTEDRGVINYNPENGKCISLVKGKWLYGSVTDFLFEENKIWVSCSQKGLMLYNLKTSEVKLYDNKNGAGLTAVKNLLQDKEGNIWAGTMSGILRTQGDCIEFIEEATATGNTNIAALAVDKNGSTWYSNNEGLFKRSVDSDGIIYIEQPLLTTEFKDYSIISLYIDRDGFLWAGSYGSGALRIDPVKGSIRHISNELRDGNVLSIDGKDDKIWFATLGGAAQIDISGGDLSIKNYTRDDGLSSDYIYQVFVDSRNRTWFGTDGKGVDMLDNEGFHHYGEGLNSQVVFGFAEDGEHHIWANVQGDGVYKFDGEKFISSKKYFQLHDKNINCFSSDNAGNLIMVHDLGIEIYDGRNNKIKYLGEQVGIHEKKPNLNAVAKDENGRIFFGTSAGIIVYSNSKGEKFDAPQPQIAGLKLFDKDIEMQDKLELKNNENNITFNYLGFWYQNPENLNYQYKLENYDRNWINSKNREVTYSSLPPGKYTFRLRVSETDDFSTAEEATYGFEILAPFWQTAWFYICCFIALFILGEVFVRYRERNLQKDNQLLEMKNAELNKINHELDKFVYSVSHDLRAPLLSMQGIVEITEELTNEEETVEHMKMLKESITRLDNFIGEILDYSRNARSEIKHDIIDFNKLLKEITQDLQHMNGAGKPVEINVEINGAESLCSDKGRVSVVLNNIISNSIRYHNPAVDKPYVNIRINGNSNETKIEIEDNGIGIDEINKEKVFDMFYRVSEHSNGSGLGLYIVKETVDKLQGHIELQSTPGVGTKFSLSIPNQFFQ